MMRAARYWITVTGEDEEVVGRDHLHLVEQTRKVRLEAVTLDVVLPTPVLVRAWYNRSE